MGSDRIPVPVKPLVAGALKTAIHHVRLVEQELMNIGAALNADQIGEQRAIDLAEEVAPGLLGFLSPLCGLSLPRKSDTAAVESSTSEVAA